MKKILISLLIAVVVLSGGAFFFLGAYSPHDHLWEDYQSWYKTSGSDPITGDDTRFLDGKHKGAEGYRVIYINDIGEGVNKGSRPYVYPAGSVLVKEQYKNRESFESSAKPELSIMIKLTEGASPETGDWGYVTLLRHKIHKGVSSRAKFCGGCHRAANLKMNDYVFVNSSTLNPLK